VTFGPHLGDRRPCPVDRIAPDHRRMTKPLDALVVESRPGEASPAVATGEDALGELRREILRLVAALLGGAGILAGQAVCRIEPLATRLDVTFDLPVTVTPSVKQALAVRVLDAVRGAGRTYGAVQVSVHDVDDHR
jgi:hypothetical protein